MFFRRFLLAATTALILAVMLITAMPTYAAMWVDMPEEAQDPYNIDPDEVWISSDDVKYILDAWERTNAEREKVGAKPLILDWELCRVCKFRAIELTVNFNHERANGDEDIWEIKNYYNTQYEKNAENITRGAIENANTAVTLFVKSTDGHREAVLGEGEYCETANVIGVGVVRVCRPILDERELKNIKKYLSRIVYASPHRCEQSICCWYTTGYKPLDPYDPEKNNMPKSLRQITVVERERKQALVPIDKEYFNGLKIGIDRGM